MPTNGNTNKWRIEQLEKNYDRLNNKVDLIMSNHLPHIQQSLIEVKTRMNVLTVLNVGAIILALVISRYLG